MTILNIPIEPIPERYSCDWREWSVEALDNCGEKSLTIDALPLTEGIEEGRFLDIYGTASYKSQQMENLAKMLHAGVLSDGDWVFFHDLWFPGIQHLAYMRDASGIDFKIAGCLHAGSWDEHDFIRKVGMASWGRDFEKSLLELSDLIFVATNFHKDLINNYFFESNSNKGNGYRYNEKMKVVRFPVDAPYKFSNNVEHDPNLIVFPHRLDDEKQPELVDALQSNLSDTNLRIIKTMEVCDNKSDYYELLAKARYSVSFALQETFGIAMIESLYCGALPLVPNRLSYKELYPASFQYRTIDELESKIRELYYNEDLYQLARRVAYTAQDRLREETTQAFPKMIKLMQNYRSTKA